MFFIKLFYSERSNHCNHPFGVACLLAPIIVIVGIPHIGIGCGPGGDDEDDADDADDEDDEHDEDDDDKNENDENDEDNEDD